MAALAVGATARPREVAAMSKTLIVGLAALAAFLGAYAGSAVGKSKSYTYKTDPPPGVVKCGLSVTVKSSRRCNGRPATIVGGCNTQGTGAPRQVTCH
jgi:hypothetical protein